LFALVDTQCKFIASDAGLCGRNSDKRIYTTCNHGEVWKHGKQSVP